MLTVHPVYQLVLKHDTSPRLNPVPQRSFESVQEYHLFNIVQYFRHKQVVREQFICISH